MNNNLTAGAIFVGFAMVAGAIYFSGTDGVTKNKNIEMQQDHDTRQVAADTSATRDEYRFVYGNSEAAVTIVEFSDFECPFCARLHPTLQQIVDESDGKINWEYRHLPLPSHRNAEFAAAVSECVGRNLGNEAFWSYSDTIFSNQRSVNPAFLTETAVDLGMTEEEIQSCSNSEVVEDQIRTDLATARALGGSGTPFSVIVYADGTMRPVSGALPYANWQPLLSGI